MTATAVAVLAAACADGVRPAEPPLDPPRIAWTSGTGAELGDEPAAPSLYDLLVAVYGSYDFPAPVGEALKDFEAKGADQCAAAASLTGAILDAAGAGSPEKGFPLASAAAALRILGTACPTTAPMIARVVPVTDGTTGLESDDQLVALGIPGRTFDREVLVVAQRLYAGADVPPRSVLKTALSQYGPYFQLSNYPAAVRTKPIAFEYHFVGPYGPSAAVLNWLGIGTNSGDGATTLSPIFCSTLARRVLSWGGASFLQPTQKASADLDLGGFGTTFVNDSASTSGSGCGQVPPPSSDGSFLADPAARDVPATSFEQSAGVAPLPTTRIGLFGVIQLYDPARSADVRAGLSLKVCGSDAQLTNHTTSEVLAVIDPINRATGRWSGWKHSVLVPAATVDEHGMVLRPGTRSTTLPIPPSYTVDEVQLSYGPESLGHASRESCPLSQ